MIGNITGIRKIFLIMFVTCLVFPGCSPKAQAPETEGSRALSDAQYKKEMDEMKKSIKGDIRIKLKKDGKGAYTWEISGRDPHQIINANQVLNRRVASESRE